MRINNNLMAMNAHRQLGMTNVASGKTLEKLSSGYRINRAGDDAAGLSISEKMRAQVRGLNMASKNSQDGISLIQTAEGALNEVHAILQRMRELVVQAGNGGTMADDDRKAVKDEIGELIKELDGIADRTEFNGKTLLDGTYEGTLQIGANEEQVLTLNLKDIGADNVKGSVKASDLEVDDLATTITGENVADPDDGTGTDAGLAKVDKALGNVSKMRSYLGANQNRLEHTIKNLDNAAENLQAAESRIRDVDMAKEMMEFTKNNILQQAATAMLAQANQVPQSVLQLLR